jgi:hypothetical protein
VVLEYRVKTSGIYARAKRSCSKKNRPLTRRLKANLTNVSPLCGQAVLVDADNIEIRLSMPVQNWKPVLNRFTIQFGERMTTNEHSPLLHKIRDILASR